MLKSFKRSILRSLQAVGVNRALERSEWRRQRLVILCYHSLSLNDEHRWNSSLYITPERFEGRLEILRKGRWNVLPLGEAVRRLYANDLPERSVVITFDDGTYDVYNSALPRLEAFGFPSTVYLTTHYCGQNLPIYPTTCSYILWRRQSEQLKLAEVTGQPFTFDLSDERVRFRAFIGLLNFAQDEGLTTLDKQELLLRLSSSLKFDFEELTSRRMLHIMNPDEVRAASERGTDFQLHTHRHRTPLDEALFRVEIRENRQRITEMTGSVPTHFCYPSGVNRSEFIDWLADEKVESATVCNTGIASQSSHPLLLPRVVDHGGLSDLEFRSWLTGGSALLPTRKIIVDEVDRSGRALLPRQPERAGA